ncbi:MAG: DUF748 domain-containing protein [Bacteroidota bacterium]|nr:DUF748 domain-containing protein [Bacteroidota bacterium]MDP3144038.1 DUF748 domain-containing protein [Bacteroidota bacterium]
MQKIKKSLIISVGIIIAIAITVILFISPLTKYLVEKYDEKYTGRKITMDRAYVNPYTGYIYFKNLKIYELKSDSVFISIKGVSINIEMLKLLSKTYEISEIQLDQPRGIIIQNKKELNFTDLIEKFSPKNNSTKSKEPIHFNILNIKINDGEFYYSEKIIPINYSIKNVNIESSGLRWNVDTIVTKFSFLSGMGTGDIKANCTINIKTLDYRLASIVQNFNLNIVEQYLKDLTNYGSFAAILNADMNTKGNFKNTDKISISGALSISDFHFGKNPKEDYASFNKLSLAIKEITPNKYIYTYDSVSLNKPYLKYEKYDNLDNIQTMFGEKGANYDKAKADKTKFNLLIELANYIKIISENFFKSPYKINRLGIYNASLKFNDYSTREKFSVDLSPLYLIADSINKNNPLVNFSLKSGIEPYGSTKIKVSINPKEEKDFDITYNLQNIPLTLFNPYIIPLTSFSVDRGTIELNGKWKVRNGIINSNNHIVIIDPRVKNRVRSKNMKWLPLPAIMFIVREQGNVIDYEIPISGNLKNPKFQLRDVIFDAIENIFIKPPTTQYRLKIKNIEREIENSLMLTWQPGKNSIQPNEAKIIKDIATFLSKNPEANIIVHPNTYETKEKESILFFEAKKKYYISLNNKNPSSLSENDLENIERMSVKDSLFIHYLNKHITGTLVFTVQEKCERFIGKDILNEKYNSLIYEREKSFLAYFKDKDIEKQIKIDANQSVIPYNGFSFYKIEYKGQLPESLLNAYEKIKELNNEAPRKKYKNERKGNKNTL